MQALAAVRPYAEGFSTIATTSLTYEQKAMAEAAEKVIRQIRKGETVNRDGIKNYLQTLVENNWFARCRQ